MSLLTLPKVALLQATLQPVTSSCGAERSERGFALVVALAALAASLAPLLS